jgi:hypothetical protein
MDLNQHEMKALFDRTVVVRQPRYGIVSGYHELPYVCLGEAIESGHQTTEVRGKVQVSPRFLIRPEHLEPSYEEIFGSEHTSRAIAGRMFGFLGFRDRPVECTSEFLKVAYRDVPIDQILAETLDELERMEDITTSVLISPNPEYFPVSIERLISAVLEDEFNV